MKYHEPKNLEITDYISRYQSIIHNNKNKESSINRWFPFVEGYSAEFIKSIISEQQTKPLICIDPFSGSGTTALELQKNHIKCYSIEVNPFLYLLTKTKLRTDYSLEKVIMYYQLIKNDIYNMKININALSLPHYNSIVEKSTLKKWIYDKNIFKALMQIKSIVFNINEDKYRNLFLIAFSSILLEVSNVYRNGKCLTYKKNWRNRINYSQGDVKKIYTDRLKHIIIPDILLMETYKKIEGKLYNNYKNCKLGDVRNVIRKFENNIFDLVITSPPYLNSRDYTDIYMIELWMLDLIISYDELMQLRKNTLHSHVQVTYKEVDLLDIDLLKNAIAELKYHTSDLWNRNLIKMIKAYFLDINLFFSELFNKLKPGGKIYFNVANSEFLGIEIEVDKICAEIAAMNDFNVREIRLARYIKHRSKHHNEANNLRESVLIIEK